MRPICEETNTSPINVDELLARCVGRVDLLEKTLVHFEQCMHPQVSQLEEYAQQGDMESLRTIVHRLRGAALTVAANSLSQSAEQLEKALTANSSTCPEKCLENVLEECGRISTWLRARSTGA
jgi:HPt (histidine-containing phosphotransfer) domain-containing protein